MNYEKRKEKKTVSIGDGPDHEGIARFRGSYQMHGLTSENIKTFRTIILDFFKKHGRALPWRETIDPYRILVSEIMLQQTQVDRVVDKYNEFIYRFPTAEALAASSLQEVLSAWLGLGYNRRALALKKCAETVVTTLGGVIPQSEKELIQLPGVGAYTVAAIGAFAFNQPVVLVETNIRTVFIHFFFKDRESVPDKEIVPLVAKTLYRSNPRKWYNALMDYGVMLKKQFPNPSRRSAHYAKQSRFEGSDRQIRGMILRMLDGTKGKGESSIIKGLGVTDPGRARRILLQLCKEGFIEKKAGGLVIK